MTRPLRSLPRPQQGGVLSGTDQFRAFLAERHGVVPGEDPAPFLRNHCGVASRRELATNAVAGRLFDTLVTEYDAWRGRIAGPDGRSKTTHPERTTP